MNYIIIKHDLDFMFLTETSLDQDNSAAVLLESVPPKLIWMSEALLHKKREGVAALFNYYYTF